MQMLLCPAGALSNLTLALCGTAGGQANATQNNKLYSEFWCSYEVGMRMPLLRAAFSCMSGLNKRTRLNVRLMQGSP